MNILHHKSWHVRNKDNIARVRKDEAKAAEEERKKQDQVKRAEQEVRIEYLRSKTRADSSMDNEKTEKLNHSESISTNFNEIKKNITQKSNKDYEYEKKEEKEKYEKQIGCLTYLGQCKDNNVSDGNLKSWYDLPPKNRHSLNSRKEEDSSSSLNAKDEKIKEYNDPLKYYFKDKDKEKKNKNIKHEKKKKDKKEKLSKKDLLKKLRKERLNREAREKERQNILLAKSIGIDNVKK